MEPGSWKERIIYHFDKPFNNVSGPTLSRIHRALCDIMYGVAFKLVIVSLILKQAKAGHDCAFRPVFFV